MMPPYAYRDARMAARYHIQAKIVRNFGSTVEVKVVRVFRGLMWPGTKLTLYVSLYPDTPPPPGGTIYTDPSLVASARYIEAFLDDNRQVVLDQIKFLKRPTLWPTGKPAEEGFLW